MELFPRYLVVNKQFRTGRWPFPGRLVWRFVPLLVVCAPLHAAPRQVLDIGRTTVRGARSPSWLDTPPATSATLDLLDAAVAADPLVSRETRQRLHRAAWRLIARSRDHVSRITSDAARAEALFDFMHREFLYGVYDAHCGHLQRTLDDGTHNCLMSTLVYLVLCRDAAIAAQAIASPGHVAVQIEISGAAYRIETTDRRWRPQTYESDPRSGKAITDRALIGRVHYNLGIHFAGEGNFPLAIQATRQSVRLDPTHLEARTNLLSNVDQCIA